LHDVPHNLENDWPTVRLQLGEDKIVKGPIGYELSPMATEATQLLDAMEEECPFALTGMQRLREIIEVMDVEILSRGIALANSKSNELTRGSVAEELGDLVPAPSAGVVEARDGGKDEPEPNQGAE
jgi:hypothetical protein